MRKAIVVCLVLLFVLSIAGPVFAAEGTFCDVPKNHWSYEAIDELVKAGVIDNSSKIFNGDRMVTRYEMALMVAKAMERADKTQKDKPENKAIIQKLVAEYGKELQDLGVRLSAAEAEVAKTKNNYMIDWTGTELIMEFPYYKWRDMKDGSRVTSTVHEFDTKIKGAVKLDNGLTFNFGLEADKYYTGKSSASMPGYNPSTNTFSSYSRDIDNTILTVSGPFAGGNLMFGRWQNSIWLGVVTKSYYSGVQYGYKSNKLKGHLCYGTPEPDAGNSLLSTNKSVNWGAVDTTYSPDNKTDLVGVYYRTRSCNSSYVAANIYEGGFHRDLGEGFNLYGDYAQSSRTDQNDAYLIMLNWGKADYNKPESHAWYIMDIYNGKNASLKSNYDLKDYTYGQKGITLLYQYVPKKNIRYTSEYISAKPIDKANANYTRIRWFYWEVEFFY